MGIRISPGASTATHQNAPFAGDLPQYMAELSPSRTTPHLHCGDLIVIYA